VDPTVQVALIVAIFAFVGPVVMAAVTYLVHRSEKKQDYARQDAVAANAAEAARKLSIRQDQTAAKADIVAESLLASNERVAETAKTAADGLVVTNTKLDLIHTLVNSQMTAAMEAELMATQRELAMMREVVSLKTAAGHEPSTEALGEISATEKKVSELRAKLADRSKTALGLTT
jgi:hypothetical protein